MEAGAVAARRSAVSLVAVVLVAALVGSGLAVGTTVIAARPSAADTAPVDPALPETVSAAALPTVQVDGVVWAQVIVGRRVFVTGDFTSARPAGAAPDTNEIPRSNILAFDLTTGELITSWAPTLNAQGLAIAASPDGSTIYVGGDFDRVNGQWRSRIAALDAQTGSLRPWNPGANSRVQAIAVSGGTVYYGGDFTSVGNTQSGFFERTRLAAADATTGAILPWAPSADRIVAAMVVEAASGRVVVGGAFGTLNGETQIGMGSLDPITGAVQPWPVNTVVRNYGSGARITALQSDGERVYGTGYAWFAQGASANFEGVFAADVSTGELDWVIGGRGDTYDVSVAGEVLYVAGHPHDWGMVEWNPQYPQPWRFQRAIAVHKRRSPTLYNAYGPSSTWQPFAGRPAAQPLHWLPTLTAGTFTGQGQAAWAVDASPDGDYVVLGGEFPSVNGVAQQGLVRFARRTISPTVDPIQHYTELTPTLTPLGPGRVRVGWTAAWDRDNERLKVEVLRGETTATSTVLRTFHTDTTWWERPPLGFVDATAPPGSEQRYRIRVTDPHGNSLVGPSASVTVPAGSPPASTYADRVRADAPDWYWRMDEPSGTTALDTANANDLVINSANVRGVGGALLNEANAATGFPGSSNTSTVQATTGYWQQGPQTFSLETWIRTTTTQGGLILGFGGSNTGRSSSDSVDRVLYMNNAGRIYFGVRPDMGARITINSPSSYNDGAWHHVVATLGAGGMNLYVDGLLVAENKSVTKAQVYRGYWRIAGNRLSSWPSTPTREAIAAEIDEIAVYSKALSVGRVRAHYLASGRTASFPNLPPTAVFDWSAHYRTATLDGSASFDDDGTVVSYHWDFGDGTTASGATVQHTYASAGTYSVTLTVTDNSGASASTSRQVTVVDPPPNIPPVADFANGVQYRTLTLDSTAYDEDGAIVEHSWDLGDGTTLTGATVQHTYAAAGDYTVTLTVTDDDGATDSRSSVITITDFYASDDFQRTVANGFGTADNGGPWTVSNPSSSFSVGGGAARMLGSVGANRSAWLTAVQQADVDLKADLALDRAATGGGAYASLVGRRVSNGNDYRLKLRWMPSGAVIAYLARTVGGAETTLAWTTVPGLTAGPNDVLRARFLVEGSPTTTVRAKVWRKATPEPTEWLLSNTAATPAALQGTGGLGVQLYLSSSWTGALPTLALDRFRAGPDSGPPVNSLPVASFEASSQFLDAWFDASASTDGEDGSIVAYAWDFGDGTTGTSATAQHRYAAAGTYTVTLTVTDNEGASSSATGEVTVVEPPPPSAFFVTETDYLLAAFDGSGSDDADGTIVSYHWNFGDGTTGSGMTALHRYATGGEYLVTLTVTDDRGNTGSVTQTVTVAEPGPPVPAFTWSAQYLQASFDGSGSQPVTGSIVAWDWDFGDGATGSGTTTQHTYAAGGTYSVGLTVTTDDGRTATSTAEIVVTDPPPVFAADAFERTVTNGLGSADVGGAWSLSANASGYSVSDGRGRIVTAVGANRAAYLTAVSRQDVDSTVDLAFDGPASGGGAYVSVIGRRVSNGNDYRLKLRWMPSGAVIAYLGRTVGGTETILASTTVPGLSVGAVETVRARLVVTGSPTTALWAKVWKATEPEPATWLLSSTEPTPPVLQASGHVGVLTYISTSWSGPAPVLTLDNLSVIGPVL